MARVASGDQIGAPMFSSLGKMDIVIQDTDGGQIAVQTDHRSAEEIEEDWNVSLVFAVARARNPVRAGQCKGVRFAHMAEPPARTRELVRKLGAQLEVAPNADFTPGEADPAWVDRTVEAALLALGAEVFEREGFAPDVEGLRQLEQELRTQVDGGPDSEFEIGYWTTVVELGAATILVVRQLHGGALAADEDMSSLIPYRWDVDGGLINVFGRVERFLEEDESVLPSQLLGLLADQAAGPQGEVMFTFRARDWAAKDLALTLPLLPSLDQSQEDDLPLLALVIDLPTSTKTIPKETASADVERMRAEARANLAKLPVEVADVSEGKLLVVHGSYYAAEKLLDEAFMAAIANHLGAQMLIAAVPLRGRLFVQDAMTEPDRIGAFVGLVREQHDDAPPQERISPAVMLVDAGGQLVGVARVTAGEPEN